MDVLVVAPHVPFDGIRHAGGVFLLRHLERLRRGTTGSMTLLAPASEANLHAAARAPQWLTVVLSPLDDPPVGSRQHRLDHLEHRLRGWSPTPHELRGLVGAGLAELARSADLVEVHWPEYAHLAPLLRAAGVSSPVVVVDHDVATEAERRRLRDKPSRLKRGLGHALAPLHRLVERRALGAADLVLVFKEADRDLLGGLGVATPVHVIEPWLDPPSGRPRATRPGTVLFTGALWRPENKQAALWLVREVWPRVRARVPSARLELVGAGAGSTLSLHAAEAPGVDLVGEVDDLEPSYLGAAVFAAPLHVGGGLKFKVPQAMLLGLPVVATSVAAEGVVELAPPDTFWAVTDEPAAFADALVSALSSPDQAERTGQRAAAWCADHYGFERSGRRLLEEYARLVQGAWAQTGDVGPRSGGRRTQAAPAPAPPPAQRAERRLTGGQSLLVDSPVGRSRSVTAP